MEVLKVAGGASPERHSSSAAGVRATPAAEVQEVGAELMSSARYCSWSLLARAWASILPHPP